MKRLPRRRHVLSCRDTTNNKDRSSPCRAQRRQPHRQPDSSACLPRPAPPIVPPGKTAAGRTKEETSQQFPTSRLPLPTSLLSFLKRICSETIKVPLHFSIGYRELTCQLTIARYPESPHVDKTEITAIQA